MASPEQLRQQRHRTLGERSAEAPSYIADERRRLLLWPLLFRLLLSWLLLLWLLLLGRAPA